MEEDLNRSIYNLTIPKNRNISVVGTTSFFIPMVANILCVSFMSDREGNQRKKRIISTILKIFKLLH